MMKIRSLYYQSILEELARTGNLGIDPRHVEAYMRIAHPTLDGLGREAFNREVCLSVRCARVAGREEAEQVARSFGL